MCAHAQDIWEERRLGVTEGMAIRELREFWAEWQAPEEPPATAGALVAHSPNASDETGGALRDSSDVEPRAQLELNALLEASRLRQEARLGAADLQRLLLCEGNSARDTSACALAHDMTRPLTEYFISSSHNTYLTGHQVRLYRRPKGRHC